MRPQLDLEQVPGTVLAEDGRPVFLQTAPGLFATWVYPLALLLLLLVNQPLALWLVLAAGVYAHGVRYPRVYEVFYPVYFYLSVALVALLPVVHLVLTLATGVSVTDAHP